jgi:hypothetical protein
VLSEILTVVGGILTLDYRFSLFSVFLGVLAFAELAQSLQVLHPRRAAATKIDQEVRNLVDNFYS